MSVCVSLTVGMFRYVCVCMCMCEYLCVCVGDVYSVLNMCSCACMSFLLFYISSCMLLFINMPIIGEKRAHFNYPRGLDKKS